MKHLSLFFVVILALLLTACQAPDSASPASDSSSTSSVISWEEAIVIINSGEVEMASQNHKRDVFLTLQDGTQYRTMQPQLDDLFTVVNSCGQPCANIALASE